MKSMFRPALYGALLVAALGLSSCADPYYAGPREANGTVAGALLGGTAGAIIGNQSGRPLEGAAIGGVLGAVAGNTIGRSQDYGYYGYSRPYYSGYYPRSYYYDDYYAPSYYAPSYYPAYSPGISIGYSSYSYPRYRYASRYSGYHHHHHH